MKADRSKFEKERELEEKKLNTVIKDEADAMQMYAVSCYIAAWKWQMQLKPCRA